MRKLEVGGINMWKNREITVGYSTVCCSDICNENLAWKCNCEVTRSQAVWVKVFMYFSSDKHVRNTE